MSLVDKLLGTNLDDEGHATLKSNGEVFEGFESGTITLTMENVYNEFDLSYVADGKSLGVRAIFPGDEVSLALDDEVVLEGYVDETSDDDDEQSVQLRATGRSRTGDVADCSAIEAPFTWKNVTVDRIALDLCRPLGIDVSLVGAAGTPLEVFSLIRGETVADAILRACRRRAKLAYTVGGDLVLATVGSTRTSTVLERGSELVVRWSRTDSWAQRFSDYVFSAQAPGKDDRWGKSAAQIKHKVKDGTITRYRPLLVEAEGYHVADLETRSTLERNQRAGRGERISVVVRGWFTAEGNAWRPNTLVRLRNPVLGVDADLLVSAARFRFGSNEPRETELMLARPEAFYMTPYPVVKRGAPWK